MKYTQHGTIAETVLATTDGQEAIARYLQEASALLAEDPAREVPDPMPFFEHLQPLRGRLIAGAAPLTEDFNPSRLLCPGGNGECWRERVGSGKDARWVVVCNCY